MIGSGRGSLNPECYILFSGLFTEGAFCAPYSDLNFLFVAKGGARATKIALPMFNMAAKV